MPGMFTAIAVHARESLKDVEAFRRIVADLQQCSSIVALTPEAQNHVEGDFAGVDFHTEYDFFVVFGGDGSVLNIVHRMENWDVPLMPISAGTLGFLAEIPPEAFGDCCHKLATKEFTIDTRALFDVVHTDAAGKQTRFHALNEAVVSQRAVARMVSLRALVNGEYLTTYRADGVMVATPTGSTAYSLAAGGPIVYPRFDALILTPVSPHSFTHRSLILPADKRITITQDETNREPVMLTIDGQITVPLEKGEQVEIGISAEKLKFLRMPEEHFLKTLKRKLHWGRNAV